MKSSWIKQFNDEMEWGWQHSETGFDKVMHIISVPGLLIGFILCKLFGITR